MFSRTYACTIFFQERSEDLYTSLIAVLNASESAVFWLSDCFLRAARFDEAVMLDIATRADCLEDSTVEYLAQVAERTVLTVELGLQTAHDGTAEFINRGHTFADFVRGYERLRNASDKINICVHIIFGLPGENRETMLKTVKDVAALGADEVIVATGSKARSIPVPGADKAIEAVDYLLGNKTVGENVTVIGGGLTGCEIAYELYLDGKKPVIVEMQDDLITTPGVALANTSFLRDFFKANKVPVHLETALCEIGDGSVKVKDKDGKVFDIPADSVIMSVGYVPTPVAPKGKHIHVIGDAAKVGNLRTVIWGAWDIAMKL